MTNVDRFFFGVLLGLVAMLGYGLHRIDDSIRRLDPCAGHVTPDGITATDMGPCDEMPAVP